MTNTIKRVTPQTLAILAVLEAAHRDGREVYGWEIRKAAGCPGSVVTGVLARLEAAGAITFRWDDSPGRGPRRRYCRLTEAGAAEVTALLTSRRAPAAEEAVPAERAAAG
jgi:DNA-binding PadR family transcriptional regulator